MTSLLPPHSQAFFHGFSQLTSAAQEYKTSHHLSYRYIPRTGCKEFQFILDMMHHFIHDFGGGTCTLLREYTQRCSGDYEVLRSNLELQCVHQFFKSPSQTIMIQTFFLPYISVKSNSQGVRELAQRGA